MNNSDLESKMAPVPVSNRDDPDKGNGNDEVENMEMPQFVVAQSSSAESDEEDSGYQGYQLLPQDSDQIVCHYDQGDADEQMPASSNAVDDLVINTLDQGDALATAGNSTDMFTAGPSSDSSERKLIWNAPRDSTQQAPMDPDHAEKIKAAMSGFQLPKSHLPDWANVIPEEEWKTQLIAKLGGESPSSQKDSRKPEDSGS